MFYDAHSSYKENGIDDPLTRYEGTYFHILQMQRSFMNPIRIHSSPYSGIL
jgi:hypothetical protein